MIPKNKSDLKTKWELKGKHSFDKILPKSGGSKKNRGYTMDVTNLHSNAFICIQKKSNAMQCNQMLTVHGLLPLGEQGH